MNMCVKNKEHQRSKAKNKDTAPPLSAAREE